MVAVLSSAAVAITVPFINSGLERDRLEWQTNGAKREEFRRLLDGSMQRLLASYQLMIDVAREKNQEPFPRVRLQRLAAEVADMTERIAIDSLRIGLVVGDQAPVTKAHERVSNTFATFELELSGSVPDGGITPPDSSAFIEGFDQFREEARRYIAPASD